MTVCEYQFVGTDSIPGENAAARSKTFSNSRIFSGQLCFNKDAKPVCRSDVWEAFPFALQIRVNAASPSFGNSEGDDAMAEVPDSSTISEKEVLAKSLLAAHSAKSRMRCPIQSNIDFPNFRRPQSLDRSVLKER